MRRDDLVILRPEGMYCPRGDFYIDPWRGVDCAVLTHGHADHARSGSVRYHAAESGLGLLQHRLGASAHIVGHGYGETFVLGDARVSLHSAGHILGSSQVRIEVDGEVWVVTGDFKRDADPTCTPFDVVRCDTLITEATFGLPCYRWPAMHEVVDEVLDWWDQCAREHVPAVMFCYALGKAQRLLAELAERVDRTVFLHGAMTPLVERYRDANIRMLPGEPVGDSKRARDFSGELILAPPSAAGSPWMRRFNSASTAFASGWMQIRGNRRRRGYDRGFVVSDHSDWPGLIRTVEESGARRVLATHGSTDSLVRYLNDRGVVAAALKTEFGGDDS